METEEKLALIKRNTEEIITEDELKTLLKSKKQPAVYLGTAITGRPHIGYFLWVLKLADFLKAGFKVKVLLSDITGALDNTPWEILESRYDYYSKIIPLMFKSIGLDTKELEFVKSSDINLSKEYYLDLLKLSTIVSVRDSNKAASEVVKMGDNPRLSGLIYPLVQALDEEYLKVDVQYGGVDQRKILMFARENLPKMGYQKRIEIMTPLIPSLSAGGKMSASDKASKIDLLDSEADVKKKLNSAFCPEGIVEENGVLAFCKYVLMTIKSDNNEEFKIERPEKFGGNLSFKTYEELEKTFAEKKLHPMDLKQAVAKEVNKLLEPIRKKTKSNEALIKKAYPDN